MKAIFIFTILALVLLLSTPLDVQAQSVLLQSSTPGTTQTGHMNINGTGLFGRVGIGTLNPGNVGLYANKAFSTANAVYGLRSSCTNTLSGISYGTFSSASNTSSGNAYGGYFTTTASGTGVHYGVIGTTGGNSNSPIYGAYGSATNSSTGIAYGGYFVSSSTGSGSRYGVYGLGNGSSASSHYGAYGSASNTSTGAAYGGYFTALSGGTGTHYGVYGVEAAGGSGAAVYAAGDMAASGAKTAVVKTSSGHRLMYAQESPEVWFEDYGEGRLVNGQAHIELDPVFLETVTITGAHPLKVFVQLTSEISVPVFVKKNLAGFDVHAQGRINASFDYRVVAKRKGYETDRLRKTDAGREDPNLYPERWREMEKRTADERQHREQLEREQLRHQEEQESRPGVDTESIKLSAPIDFTNKIPLVTPEANGLIQNHPNPFNPSTKIQFDVKQAGRVTLKVFNSLGQEVANLLDQNLPAGRHTTNFDATGLPSGAYFYKLSMNGFTEVKRMELVK